MKITLKTYTYSLYKNVMPTHSMYHRIEIDGYNNLVSMLDLVVIPTQRSGNRCTFRRSERASVIVPI